MITERDLQEAIAECEGERNPNANTCLKLAAFYTIRNELFGNQEQFEHSAYSYAPAPTTNAGYVSESEFGEIVSGKDIVAVLGVIDELMATLQIINPRLYNSVIRKLNQI